MKEDQKIITLSDGRNASIGKFKGKHIIKAQQMSKDQNDMIFALIAICVTIDGNAVALEDLKEMNGPDVLLLMGEFSENFTQGEKK
jgi:hypothetical protein